MSKQTKSLVEGKLLFKRRNCWEHFTEKDKRETFKLCGEYKEFLDNSKTERTAIKNGVEIARKNGFISIDELKKEVKKNNKKIEGSKVYVVKNEKNLILAVLGKDIIKDGANFIVSHIFYFDII